MLHWPSSLKTACAQGADLPATLRARARSAVAKAKAYIEGRQSTNGGFCFYRYEYVDEPNLHDTYHAVAALTLLRAEVPRVDELAQFLDAFSLLGAGYYYYYAFTLDMIGRASGIDAKRLARIRSLPITAPVRGTRIVTSGWLQGTLRTIRLKERFAEHGKLSPIARFVENLKTHGGYGDKPNLWDTYLCLSILAILGRTTADPDVGAFVDRVQVPSFGFSITSDSIVGNLEVVYAGTKCCALLGLPIRYRADALAFVLACQTSKGGFARAPSALPDIELTRRALQVVGVIGPDLLML